MCGITGIYREGLGNLENIVCNMASAIAYRGPDDYGTWVEPQVGLAFGHRRLSILDLSPLGHQPMHSQSGRFSMVYNGEIYNFQHIKDELLGYGHKFKGGSDTEVMLAAFEQWGIEEAVRKFNGMFVFAVWDIKQRELILGRDRLGVKPLYYGWTGKNFLFASELKAFKAAPESELIINREAVVALLFYGYIPAPQSIYRGIYKLLPGTILRLPLPLLQRSADFCALSSPKQYWSAESAAFNGLNAPMSLPDEEILEHLDSLLKDATKIRMIADVPLGVFLSGGIDSSLVTSLMQQQSAVPVRSFSIGFREQGYDEAQFAKRVAEHLGTAHTEFYLDSKEAQQVVYKLGAMFDEPFADASAIPTYLVSKLAREHVTVALAGDAGDELFCGYSRYMGAERFWRIKQHIPSILRGTASIGLRAIPANVWSTLLTPLIPLLPDGFSFKSPGEKLHKLSRLLGITDQVDFYRSLTAHWEEAAQMVKGAGAIIEVQVHNTQSLNLLSYMMLQDLVHYLPYDILTKVDRTSMAVSLEARGPFLDYRVVEFAWRLPRATMLWGGRSKGILRKLLARYVPSALFERPKMGFAVPLAGWLREDLKDWAAGLLDRKRLEADGFFESQAIVRRWEEHQSGKRDWQNYLWDILMFQAWLDENK